MLKVYVPKMLSGEIGDWCSSFPWLRACQSAGEVTIWATS